jgi:hypothetical protein
MPHQIDAKVESADQSGELTITPTVYDRKGKHSVIYLTACDGHGESRLYVLKQDARDARLKLEELIPTIAACDSEDKDE